MGLVFVSFLVGAVSLSLQRWGKMLSKRLQETALAGRQREEHLEQLRTLQSAWEKNPPEKKKSAWEKNCQKLWESHYRPTHILGPSHLDLKWLMCKLVLLSLNHASIWSWTLVWQPIMQGTCCESYLVYVKEYLVYVAPWTKILIRCCCSWSFFNKLLRKILPRHCIGRDLRWKCIFSGSTLTIPENIGTDQLGNEPKTLGEGGRYLLSIADTAGINQTKEDRRSALLAGGGTPAILG